jgi:hypothetical protein
MKKRSEQNAHMPVEGKDFYREGAYIVFTEAFLLARGYCCNSGCRNCPYRAPETKGKQKEFDERQTQT